VVTPAPTSTLKGNYAAVLTGFVGGAAFAALDLATADGYGNLSGSGTSNVGGIVSTAPISATYAINADCTGTATFSNGSTQNLIVKQDGSEVYILRTGPPSAGTVVSGTAHLLSSQNSQ
jgi:hypothetical protein